MLDRAELPRPPAPAATAVVSGLPAPRLRVLHVVRQFQPSVGGLETYVAELATRQAARHSVAILTLDRLFGAAHSLPSRASVRGVPVFRVPYVGTRRGFLPLLRPGILADHDILHVHATDQLLDTLALLKWWHGKPIVTTTHGLFFHTPDFARIKRAYLRLITKRSLRANHTVFAVSSNDRETLSQVGVDSTLLRNPIVPLGEFLCTGEDLLCVGRLAPNKRLDALVAFVAALKRPRCLHLVGGDPDGLWPALAQDIARRGLTDRIHYHGYLDVDAMRQVARRCGFAVSASRYEGFGLAIVEGMSVGLLPIMHDNAAFRETHALSGVGLITDFNNPVKAAGDFETWIGRVTPAEREAAIRFALAQTWPSVCEVYETCYRSALSGAR